MRAQQAGTTTVMYVYVGPQSTARAVGVGIYSDAGGRPGALLNEGVASSLQAGPGAPCRSPPPTSPGARATGWRCWRWKARSTTAAAARGFCQGNFSSASVCGHCPGCGGGWSRHTHALSDLRIRDRVRRRLHVGLDRTAAGARAPRSTGPHALARRTALPGRRTLAAPAGNRSGEHGTADHQRLGRRRTDVVGERPGRGRGARPPTATSGRTATPLVKGARTSRKRPPPRTSSPPPTPATPCV